MAFSPTLLAGKVGIVTGSGSPHGIGRSLVLGLAAAGAKAVYAADLSLVNVPSLQEEVAAGGSGCEVVGEALDVSSEEETARVLRRIVARHGRLDFFFANAGVASFRPLQETDGAYFDRIMAVLQRSVFLAIRYGGQAMAVVSEDKPKPGGSIVVTSSIAGTSGSVADFCYSAAKGAVGRMIRPACVQLAANHVRVNAMAPGIVQTSLMATTKALAAQAGGGGQYDMRQVNDEVRAQPPEEWQQLAPAEPRYAYTRLIQPDEIAHLGVFLASDLASAVNGQEIVADCGRTLGAFGETVTGPIAPLQPL
ncbi:hypothetical protein CDD83_9032 [Cordyceps sp. RAO-2017]|nr:hypothetical protein CDD83_9032 [Cordyceps sp. RAO-2017]